MAGLIGTVLDQSDPLKSIVGYDAETSAINPTTDTVAGQLDSLMAKDSPLMTGARTRASQTANNRGLLNSSMAVQAGEEAAYGAMLPIANADAGFYNQNRLNNTQAKNQALQFTAGSQNQGALQAFQGNQSLENISAQGEQQRQTQAAGGAVQSQLLAQKADIDKQLMAAEGAQRSVLLAQQAQLDQQLQQLRGTQATDLERVRAEAQTALQTLRGDQALQIDQIDNEYRTLLQTSASASSFYTAALNAMTNIVGSSTMDSTAKQSSVDMIMNNLDAYLGLLGGISGYDLGSLLNFEG